MPRQKGGKLLAEGADGCIFEAPQNWPCETPLKGYSPHDTSLVTKIVEEKDEEGTILNAIKSISHQTKNYNLVHYMGKCKPKLSGFSSTQKRVYNTHMKQLNKTEKACKYFKRELNTRKNGTTYKMYVMGKYEMTYKQFIRMIKEKPLLKNEVAHIFYSAQFPFIDTLNLLIENKQFTIVNYDLHSKNIVVFKNPKKEFKLSDSTTYQVGVADFGRAIWKMNAKSYTYETFETWDKPYIDAFFEKDEELGDTYSNFNQFSLEARLLNFIATFLNRKSDEVWVERYMKNKYVKKASIDDEMNDIILLYLPSFVESVRNSKQYREYEESLEKLVRVLVNKTPKEQFEVLNGSPNLRTFFDTVKKRSHIPTAFGVFVMYALRACKYSRRDISYILNNPHQIAIYVPEKMRRLVLTYIGYMLEPFYRT